LEGVIVGAAVVVASAYLLRRAWRLFRPAVGEACGCASTGDCPAAAPLAEGMRRAAQRVSASRRP
jgi:hypothetical protein